LIPAKMLMELAQKMTNAIMYNLYKMPNSRYLGKCNRDTNGLGTNTPVPPEYAVSNGKDAKHGNRSLTRHGISNTSSAKPKNNMKQIVASAALKSTSQASDAPWK
jgi:hypothetical protein